MKIAIFDVDDTLIIHSRKSGSYYKKCSNDDLKKLILSKGFDKIYFYTNGTYGHGEGVAYHLDIQDHVSFIYGRDNLEKMIGGRKHMKPSIESFMFVDNSIKYDCDILDDKTKHEFYFFDDLKNNLYTAKLIGWKTILIKPENVKEDFIDYIFPNIYSALISMVI